MNKAPMVTATINHLDDMIFTFCGLASETNTVRRGTSHHANLGPEWNIKCQGLARWAVTLAATRRRPHFLFSYFDFPDAAKRQRQGNRVGRLCRQPPPSRGRRRGCRLAKDSPSWPEFEHCIAKRVADVEHGGWNRANELVCFERRLTRSRNDAENRWRREVLSHLHGSPSRQHQGKPSDARGRKQRPWFTGHARPLDFQR